MNVLVDCLFDIDPFFMSHLNGRFSYADYVSDITTGIEYRNHLVPDGALRSKYQYFSDNEYGWCGYSEEVGFGQSI